MSVVPLQSGQGSYLCSLSLYRMSDGSIRVALEDMPSHVIEADATIAARFFRAAEWCLEGVLDLMRQGVRFDEETRSLAEPKEMEQ